MKDDLSLSDTIKYMGAMVQIPDIPRRWWRVEFVSPCWRGWKIDERGCVVEEEGVYHIWSYTLKKLLVDIWEERRCDPH